MKKYFSILLLIVLVFIACAEKPDEALIEDIDLRSAIQANPEITATTNNASIGNDATMPQNVKCDVVALDNNIIQIEVIWDNSISEYNGHAIAGYQYFWEIYGERAEGFIDIDDRTGQFVGTSISFRKQESNEEIGFFVRSDYGGLSSDYVEKYCDIS